MKISLTDQLFSLISMSQLQLSWIQCFMHYDALDCFWKSLSHSHGRVGCTSYQIGLQRFGLVAELRSLQLKCIAIKTYPDCCRWWKFSAFCVHIPGISLKSLHSCVEVLLTGVKKKDQTKTVIAQWKEIGWYQCYPWTLTGETSMQDFFWEQWIGRQTEESLKSIKVTLRLLIWDNLN